ncbi:MAG: type IV pilus twitching motility protein PilT [Elusimicrobiota bacterium]
MRITDKLRSYLQTMSEIDASDLHLRVGSRPIFRVNGELKMAKNYEELNDADTEEIANELMNDHQRELYEKRHEVDLSFSIKDMARFRANVFQQRGFVNIVLRFIPNNIQNFEQLNLPHSLKKIASQDRGLILVTGTTGCGKTTTLASMIDYINRKFSKHIITIEDPIEFIHQDKKSIISQRELGNDTYNYVDALKHIVRQDPDVILIGEMRDMDTMAAAITAAQTGHLVFSTTHTTAAIQTISRIVDIFPPHQQNQIRIQLADSLSAVISLRLLRRKDREGMIPAAEVLVVTSLISSLIEENKFSSIHEHLEKGDYYGMQTFNQSLERLYKKGMISLDDAKKAATNPEDLMLKIRGIQSESGAKG